MELQLQPIGGYLLWAVIAAALLALLRIGAVGVIQRRRRVLLGLRLAAIVVALLVMLRPAIVYTHVKKQSASLLILLDQSRSMQVGDGFGDSSRWATLRTVLADAAPTLAGLAEDLELKFYVLDTNVAAVEADAAVPQLPDSPEGEQTAIGAALDDVLRAESNKRIAAVVLCSDGVQRAYAPRDIAPQTAARRLADWGYPLHTVTFGESRSLSETRDVALDDLMVPATVFANNRLTVGGLVRTSGYVGEQIPIELLFESSDGTMRRVATRSIESTGDGQQRTVELEHVPVAPGEYKLTLRIPPREGEMVTTNNERSTFITVREGGLRVFYVEGSYRPEMGRIRRAVDASPDMLLDLIIVSNEPDRLSESDFTERFKPGQYDVYLLGDVDASNFDAVELEMLATSVREGSGLAMTGGMFSFGAGGYADTALADVLPVEMSRFERQQPGEAIREELHLPGPFQMMPTPSGRTALLRLGAEVDNDFWRELPPLDGANRFRGLKRLANVLAETEDGEPLLVGQTVGNGRSLAIAVDSTWRWAMGGEADAHERFWRQVILWLARGEDDSKQDVWVRTEQRRYRPGERIDFTAGARGAEGASIVDAEFVARLVGADTPAVDVPLVRDGDHFVGRIDDSLAAADYAVELTVTRGTDLVGTARSRFLVAETDTELDNPSAEPGVMASLASVTGGRSVRPEEFSELVEFIADEPMQLEIDTQTKQTLWDIWPVYAVLVCLLSTEWYLRKRWGLV